MRNQTYIKTWYYQDTHDAKTYKIQGMASATVGIAMGGAGSAQTLETADITLMAEDLKQLPFAVRLSRFARRLIAQNIIFSLGLKLVFILLAINGEASLWMAVPM